MKVLITSARMPFALDMIRKLSAAGHEVYAADDLADAAGSHSKYLSGRVVTASPRADTESFIADVERFCADRGIEVVVPAFEEAFYLAAQRERLERTAKLYLAPFATLARLHDKVAFQRLAEGLDLPIPTCVVATSDDELREAIERWPRYFARAAFSRGGVALLTNTGPLAGELTLDDCHPTPASPWLVQEFVEGPTVCTYSTVHEGRVTAHCMYEIPRQWKHATGIGFRSIDGAASLRVISAITAELDYTGQISFDFLVTDHGLSLVECNPRATDGILLVEGGALAAGLFDPDAEPTMVEPGKEVQLDLALVGDAFADHAKRLPRTISDLARVRDAGDGWHDPLPTMYSAFAVAHDKLVSLRDHRNLQVEMGGDISWDGEPIAGMSGADAKLLAGLTGG